MTGSIREYPPLSEKLWHAPLWQEPAPFRKWASVYVDYPRMITEIVVGEGFILAVYLTRSRTRQVQKKPESESVPESTFPRPRAERSTIPHPGAHSTPEPTGAEKIPALRQNLLRKVSRDQAVMERLIEFERERLPKAPLHILYESAIERWERDNR